MTKIILRKPFDRFPHPYFYAILLDLMDVLGYLPLIGEGIDIIQTLFGLIIFEVPSIGLIGGAVDLLLPGLADIVPTFTIRVFLYEKDILK
ncbi:MAG: hypothetical protein ACP5N9_05610 [Candidatus Bilamarchaeum sp.]